MLALKSKRDAEPVRHVVLCGAVPRSRPGMNINTGCGIDVAPHDPMRREPRDPMTTKL